MSTITLTSDFGNADGYVGVMKGVILKIAPRATIVDLSHDLPSFAIEAASWILGSAAPYFADGTVHVAVVDPGVGSSRASLVISAGHQWFVGPDNGTFTSILDNYVCRVFQIAKDCNLLASVSNTFHGRDIYGPVAAHLTRGVPARQFGPEIDPRTCARAEVAPVQIEDSKIRGQIVYVDKFGNLISNIKHDLVGMEDSVYVNGALLQEIAPCYSRSRTSGAIAIPGSHGYLEIAVNRGDARALLGCGKGAEVLVQKKERRRQTSNRL